MNSEIVEPRNGVSESISKSTQRTDNVPNDLHEYYRKSVSRYLKSVLVVDDRAYRGVNSPTSAEASSFDLDPPENPDIAFSHPGMVDVKVETSPRPASTSETSNLDPVGNGHNLDGVLLARLFAEKTILCPVIEPGTAHPDLAQSEKVSFIVNMALSADVVILDWQLQVKWTPLSRQQNGLFKVFL